MIGFVPGQPFLGDLDKNLYHDRLDTPRIRINKGSVGIVEKFCTIYTFESPGGWNIIGRTPFEFFNINKKNTSILSPGDTIKFKSISKKEFFHLKMNNYFKVLRPGINSTFQDLRQIWFTAFGIVASGCMDQLSFCNSNKLVGNKISEGALEFAYQGPLLEHEWRKCIGSYFRKS